MKTQNLKHLVLQSAALLLFFATAFGATAASAGLIGTGGAPGETNTPFQNLLRPGTTAPDQEEDSPNAPTTSGGVNDSENPTLTAGYLQNLSKAYNAGMIEGYIDNRAAVSVSKRVEMYNRLTASLGTAGEVVNPVTYQSYNGTVHSLVRRLSMDYDYTAGTEVIIEYTKKNSIIDASYLWIANPMLVGRKTVQSYMGYLLISRTEQRQIAITTPATTPVTTVPVTPAPTVPATTPATDPAPATSGTAATTPATAPATTPATTPATAPATTADPIPATTPVTGGVDTPVIVPESSDAPIPATTPVTGGTHAPAEPLPVPEEASSAPSAAPAEEGESAGDGEGVLYETVEVTVISLYSRAGELLVDDLGTKVPNFTRDFSNRPVFEDADKQLWAFDGKKFIATTKDNLRAELYYDYPAIPLGEYKGVYEARYNSATGGYRYVNYKNGGTVVSANYHYAFNFGPEGIAVVTTEQDNFVHIINRRKSQVFKPGKQYTFYTDPVTGKKQYAKDYYSIPDTWGTEAIGCSGYDNGYLRLRIKTLSMMSDSKWLIIRDQYVLVDTTGKQFPIPEGYTLEGYSDGILLLKSKDGLYGYYSIKGEWIAQPIYDYARPFIQGLAVLGSKNGTVGMIDTAGNIVLPFVYTSIEDISSGLIVTYCEGIGWETYEMITK